MVNQRRKYAPWPMQFVKGKFMLRTVNGEYHPSLKKFNSREEAKAWITETPGEMDKHPMTYHNEDEV